MAEPTAYFLTFTTYGTWLYGDERGSVDDRHHVYGRAKATPNREKYKRNFRKLKWQPYTMDAKARGVVELTIEQVTKHRKWNWPAPFSCTSTAAFRRV